MVFQFPWCSLLQIAALFITKRWNFHSCWNINGNIQQQIAPLWSLALWKLSCSKLNVKEFSKYEKSGSFYAHSHRDIRSSLCAPKHLPSFIIYCKESLICCQWCFQKSPAFRGVEEVDWGPSCTFHWNWVKCFMLRLLVSLSSSFWEW